MTARAPNATSPRRPASASRSSPVCSGGDEMPGRWPPSHMAAPRPPALGPEDRRRLDELIREQPDATREPLRQRGGFRCSLTTIWRALRGRRLTRKKKTLHASERDRPDVRTKRRSFRRQVKRIEPERLVFVDETG